MALNQTYTVVRAKHATLVGGNHDIVNFGQCRQILIENRDPALDIYVRFDGTVPVAAADDNYIVRANTAKTFNENIQLTTLSLISTGAAAYSVEAHA